MDNHLTKNEIDHHVGASTSTRRQRTKELLSPQSSQETNGEVALWDREYDTLKVIPSSTRTLPSKPLLLFSEILNFDQMHTVLDAGCGIGRNATYLAQKGCRVHAVDYSKIALKELDYAARRSGVRERIVTYNCKLEETFPFDAGYFDLVLDSYVFCHFLDDEFRRNYRKELHRVTKPGGIVFSSIFSFEDEYYKEILEKGGGKHNIVTDPNNGITKRLYTEDEIKEFFSVYFEVLHLVKFEFSDVVLGKTYRRSVLALALRKQDVIHERT
jgi:SAM-dependent methyltransferase